MDASTPSEQQPPRAIKTRCCIVGGGPAGMMLGYLLARAGIDVIVLEKHGDFLRDFRGDTIHPSTLELMRELGQIRRQGYALNWEESSDGVAAVAVAVRDASGIPLASISVAVPSMRLGSIAGIRALAPDVLESAEQIHEQLHRAG